MGRFETPRQAPQLLPTWRTGLPVGALCLSAHFVVPLDSADAGVRRRWEAFDIIVFGFNPGELCVRWGRGDVLISPDGTFSLESAERDGTRFDFDTVSGRVVDSKVVLTAYESRRCAVGAYWPHRSLEQRSLAGGPRVAALHSPRRDVLLQLPSRWASHRDDAPTLDVELSHWLEPTVVTSVDYLAPVRGAPTRRMRPALGRAA
jgi:hypothetical protein